MRTILVLGAGFISGLAYQQQNSDGQRTVETQQLKVQVTELELQNQILLEEVAYTNNCKYCGGYLRNEINHPIWQNR